MKKILVFLLAAMILFQACFLTPVFADDYSPDEEESFIGVINTKDEIETKPPVIDAAAAVVLDTLTGRVLYEKNAYSRRAMASTTKIMTAILAIENGNLRDTVTVSKRADSVGGSTVPLKQGQKLTLEEMLYGLMLRSGNDAAIAVAEHIGGSVEGFLEMMNKKAYLLGARNTHFESPHGLDSAGHYSTAYDMAVITRYALQNPVFSRIVGTKSMNISIRGLNNTNEMLSLYPGADGVKTGYTGQAGRCLVTSATREKWRVISVVLGCGSRQQRAQSSKSILDYSFNNYVLRPVVLAGDTVAEIPVFKGNKAKVDAIAVDNITIPLKKGDTDRVEVKSLYTPYVKPPVAAGENLGTLEVLVNGQVIAHSPLKALSDVRSKGIFDYLEEIFEAWLRFIRP